MNFEIISEITDIEIIAVWFVLVELPQAVEEWLMRAA